MFVAKRVVAFRLPDEFTFLVEPRVKREHGDVPDDLGREAPERIDSPPRATLPAVGVGLRREHEGDDVHGDHARFDTFRRSKYLLLLPGAFTGSYSKSANHLCEQCPLCFARTPHWLIYTQVANWRRRIAVGRPLCRMVYTRTRERRELSRRVASLRRRNRARA